MNILWSLISFCTHYITSGYIQSKSYDMVYTINMLENLTFTKTLSSKYILMQFWFFSTTLLYGMWHLINNPSNSVDFHNLFSTIHTYFYTTKGNCLQKQSPTCVLKGAKRLRASHFYYNTPDKLRGTVNVVYTLHSSNIWQQIPFTWQLTQMTTDWDTQLT